MKTNSTGATAGHATEGETKRNLIFHEFNQRGVSFVKTLSFIDDGLWGFEVVDADGYVLAFCRLCEN